MKGNSLCCDAPMLLDICSDCQEHSGPILYDCDICEDTGEVSCDGRDSSGNIERGTEVRKCECRIVEPDDYNDDE